MDYQDIQNYNENISAACFFAGFTEYQDAAGNWRAIGDVAPLYYLNTPQVVEAVIVEPVEIVLFENIEYQGA